MVHNCLNSLIIINVNKTYNDYYSCKCKQCFSWFICDVSEGSAEQNLERQPWTSMTFPGATGSMTSRLLWISTVSKIRVNLSKVRIIQSRIISTWVIDHGKEEVKFIAIQPYHDLSGSNLNSLWPKRWINTAVMSITFSEEISCIGVMVH